MSRWSGCAWLAVVVLALAFAACSWPVKVATDRSTGLAQAIPTPTPQAADLPAPSPIRSPSPTPAPMLTPTPTVLPQAPAARLQFTMPVVGAHVPERLDLVPGAPRDYRAGVHEGVDFGYNAVGVPIGIGTSVVAAGAGLVVRVDVDYREPTLQEMHEMEARSLKLGKTTEADLDRFRGKQVWIDHGFGIVTRYSHLDGVAPGIAPGVRVSKGQVIAYVGKSGIPTDDVGYVPHLHFEIRVGEGYLGQGLPPAQARQLYVQALSGRN